VPELFHIENYSVQKTRQKAEAKGLAKGEREMAVKIALKMLNANRPIDEIAVFTGLSLDEVERLRDAQ